MQEIKIPNHIAIIMDGNGRWAKKRGLKRTNGHKKGAETLKEICKYAYDKGIKVLSVFAFSTENWKRDKEEVDYLMNLFIKTFNNEFKFLKDKNVKIIFSGVKDNFNEKVIKAMDKITKETKDNDGGIFNVCLNYGGQREIIEATKKISDDVLNSKIKIENINETLFSKYLFNELPPIDLMIRTSGEYRISNFMLWSLAYSELYFTDTLWPDFNIDEFNKAIIEYNNRDRRYGGIKK